ncbi:DUF4231 domain-containing protein [Vibrio splendidus]|uniref:DUF4231 domain-containing protein n=1 Tax=Vibrio splendidus TaxID=29497 RepID=UPI00352DBFD5
MQKSVQIANIETKIKHFRRKADHNKRESLWSFKLIMLSTITVPILIAYGPDDFWSKLIPSVFSGLSAFFTAWIQLRKPNQLWTLYRTAQRQLESELELYQGSAGEYKDENLKDTLLVEKTNKIYLSVNSVWTSLVPNHKDLDNVAKKKN